jgi:hypothetical protein
MIAMGAAKKIQSGVENCGEHRSPSSLVRQVGHYLIPAGL